MQYDLLPFYVFTNSLIILSQLNIYYTNNTYVFIICTFLRILNVCMIREICNVQMINRHPSFYFALALCVLHPIVEFNHLLFNLVMPLLIYANSSFRYS